jgi:hypothetical protein
MHRLEAVDRAEYARLTRSDAQPGPQRSESWSTTERAVRITLSRMSTLLGFAVPPVIRQIAQALSTSQTVTNEQWTELEMVRVERDTGQRQPAAASVARQPGVFPDSLTVFESPCAFAGSRRNSHVRVRG